MLSAGAYSIRKQATLAISLSWVGGFTNVLTLLYCDTFTSHITGSSTNLGKSIAELSWRDAGFFGGLLLAFFSGAALSGLMTETAKQAGRRSKYALPLAVEASLLTLLLAIGSYCDPSKHRTVLLMTTIASFAMGMQNATITRISGNVVRTTHLTGVITDLGLEGVQFAIWYWNQLRGMNLTRVGRVFKVSQRHPTAQRLLILLSIFFSFIAGVVGGTLCFQRVGALSFALPIFFLYYLVIVDWRRPIMDIRELDPERDPDLQLHGLLHLILPRELAIFRLTHVRQESEHRAPNFQLWVDRIPLHKKVVILVLSPLMKIDANVMLDIQQARNKLDASGRKLLVSGLTRRQFQMLENFGFIEKIGWDAVYPDLEFAIARATELLRMPQQAVGIAR